jgi:hypothetical protein
VLKNRPLLLILVCVALGALVWLDNNRGDESKVRPGPAVAPAGDGAGAGAGEPAAPADVASTDPQSENAHATADGEDKPEESPANGLQLSNPLASFDKESLQDWVARPLFAPSRKRPPAAVAAAGPVGPVAAAPQAPVYDLLGIVREGERALALMRKKADGSNFRVEVGDMLGGWRVAKIEPSAVVLERADGQSQTVPLMR